MSTSETTTVKGGPSSVASQRGMTSVRYWPRRLYPSQSIKDVVSPVFWRDVVIEFVICSFVECCVIWVLSPLRKDMHQPSTTHIGLFAGFFIYAIIEGYGPVNGAPVNPAVCWGFFLAGRMSAARSKYEW